MKFSSGAGYKRVMPRNAVLPVEKMKRILQAICFGGRGDAGSTAHFQGAYNPYTGKYAYYYNVRR